MKRWFRRLLIGLLMTGLAGSICLGIGYLVLWLVLRPTQPPLLDAPRVRRLNRDAAAYRDPAWSPDGRYLAYARADVMGPPRGVNSATFEIYIMDIETGDIEQLTRNRREDRRPNWSPDGTRIAFDSRKMTYPLESRQVWIIDITAGTREVYQCPLSCSNPVWSPDGQKLLVSMAPVKESPSQLYVLDPTTGDLERLIETEFDALEPAWSPDGARIVYTETALSPPPSSSWSDVVGWARSAWSYLVMVDSDGENAHRLSSGMVYDEDPAWAPSGRYLAFVSDGWREVRDREPHYKNEILILDLETGRVYPLLEGRFFQDEYFDEFADPAWSPDGRYIAFVYGSLVTTTDLYIAEVPEAFR